MQSGAQRQAVDLESAVTAAMEAAAGQVSERVKGVILLARLATAVHLRRPAESGAARERHGRTSGSLSPAAAPADQDAAAGLMRQGGRP
jgi:hypothetical protein